MSFDWKDKKVLVTGADGFVGSHLTQRLLALGADVRAMVYYNSFNSWGWLESFSEDEKNRLEVVCGDVKDPFFTDSAVKGCQVVFHLAALIAIPYSYVAPAAYADTNVKGTINVLEACRRYGVEKMVHTSTSEVYGSAVSVPIAETHPLQPQSPYSASKIGADSVALSYYMSFDLPVALIRPFNIFGPRQSARAVIPAVIIQALAGAEQIKLGAVSPTRDYTFVLDTVEGFLRIAETPDTVGEVTNIGAGFEISIGELAGKIIAACNSKAVVVCDQQRVRPSKSEVTRLLCDNSKAEKLLGWTPEIGLDRGLEQTVDWFRQNLASYKTDIYNV